MEKEHYLSRSEDVLPSQKATAKPTMNEVEQCWTVPDGEQGKEEEEKECFCNARSSTRETEHSSSQYSTAASAAPHKHQRTL